MLILINTLRGFSVPMFNFLIAVFGIKFFGKEDWGTLINILLWVFFVVFSLGWGNKEYLIRKYSKNPTKIEHAFYSNFLSRSALLPLALVFFFFFPFSIAIKCVALVVLMHSYNALDSLVIFYQKFSAQFIAEIVAFGIVFISVLYIESYSLDIFLELYCWAFLAKLLLLSVSFKLWDKKFSYEFSIQEFKAGFWFFALGFSGWATSKIDLYIVNLYLPKARLSEYQLLIAAFLMLQAVASFITIPFRKHMYRSSVSLLNKIQIKLNFIAIPLTSLGGFMIWLFMEQFVQLNLHYSYYSMGVLISIPSFYYTLDVLELMKNNQERKIIYMNCIGFVCNFIAVLVFIKKHEVFGVLVSVCIMQWIVLILYKLNKMRSKK